MKAELESSHRGGDWGANGQENYGKIRVMQLHISVGHAASVYIVIP